MGRSQNHCEPSVISKQSVGFSYCVLSVCLSLVQEEFLVTASFEVCCRSWPFAPWAVWWTVVHLMELQKETASGSRIWSHTFSVLGSCQCGVCTVFEWCSWWVCYAPGWFGEMWGCFRGRQDQLRALLPMAVGNLTVGVWIVAKYVN